MVTVADIFFIAVQNYRIIWTGLCSQLARDVPFSAICWATLEPLGRKLLASVDDEASAGSILGANFAAGFSAGSIGAAITCPLDVVKTRRQIEGWKDKGAVYWTWSSCWSHWSHCGDSCFIL